MKPAPSNIFPQERQKDIYMTLPSSLQGQPHPLPTDLRQDLPTTGLLGRLAIRYLDKWALKRKIQENRNPPHRP